MFVLFRFICFVFFFFFFQAEDGIRDGRVTGVQTCALPILYISSGRVAPIFVQYTSSRGPGALGCELNSRSFTSGCASGLSFTPVGTVMPRCRAPPEPARISPLATGLGTRPCGRDCGVGALY